MLDVAISVTMGLGKGAMGTSPWWTVWCFWFQLIQDVFLITSWKQSSATYVKLIQIPVSSGKNFIKKIAALITQEALVWWNLRYVTYIGNGDSSAFGSVRKIVEDKLGDQYPLHLHFVQRGLYWSYSKENGNSSM